MIVLPNTRELSVRLPERFSADLNACYFSGAKALVMDLALSHFYFT